MERALTRVENRLHEKELECESLTVQLRKTENECVELRKR